MSHRSVTNNYYQFPMALLAIVIVLLLGISIFVLTPKIQTDLAEEIQKELVKNQIPADITLSGRDVILRGNVSNGEVKEKAEAIAKKVCGIRFVDNQLLTDKPENRAQFAKNSSMAVGEQQTELNKKLESEKKVESEIKSESQVGTKSTEVEMPKQAASSEPSSALSIDNDTSDAQVAANQSTSIKKVENSLESTTESTTESTKENRKILNYDTMLAAMNAYNKQKGRNPARVNNQKIDLSFKNGSKELLDQAQANTALNDLVSRLKKNKKISIEVMVTAVSNKLALDRAKTIQHYLVTKGIDLKRVSVTGKSGNESVEVKRSR